MTLGEAKNIVHFLLDRTLLEEYADKINSYFDLGQKRVAATTDFIERIKEITVEEPTVIDLEQMEERFYKLRKVEGENEYEKQDQTHLRLQKGTYRLFYNVYPQTITNRTPDSYEFEISEIGQTALPYFVAAQVSIAEHDLRFHEVYNEEFANLLVNIDAARREGRMKIVPMGGEK